MTELQQAGRAHFNQCFTQVCTDIYVPCRTVHCPAQGLALCLFPSGGENLHTADVEFGLTSPGLVMVFLPVVFFS